MTSGNRISQYVRGSIAELKKVQWPSREQTIRYTILVIVISAAIAVFLGAFDYLFNYILEILIS